jgi:hypothetical protein
MTGIELILAALAAGAAAGAKDTAKAAVADAYGALKNLLHRRLTGRDQAQQALEATETELGVWQTRRDEELAGDLADSGADHDAEVLAAATRLLEAADPDGVGTGKYRVEVSGGQGVQVGDGTVHVGTNYGAVASTIDAPVTITYQGQPPIPPDPPAAS